MNRWDSYFYEIAIKIASNSQCLSIQRGAVLVKDKSIISTGYNGPARGIPRCDLRPIYQNNKMIYLPDNNGKCPRHIMGYKSGQGLDICIAAHAEQNCIVNAARMGVITKDSIMYMTCEIPCKYCLSLIINAGIKEIVCTSLNVYDEQTTFIYQNSKLVVRDYEENIWQPGLK
jgi:dCMP deaminase